MEKNKKLSEIKQKLYNKTGMSSFLEISGNGEILLSGCKGISDYSPEEIKVDTLLGTVVISGKSLKLSTFREDIMSVEGTISMIKLGG